jgi:hypothetical protein
VHTLQSGIFVLKFSKIETISFYLFIFGCPQPKKITIHDT